MLAAPASAPTKPCAKYDRRSPARRKGIVARREGFSMRRMPKNPARLRLDLREETERRLVPLLQPRHGVFSVNACVQTSIFLSRSLDSPVDLHIECVLGTQGGFSQEE